MSGMSAWVTSDTTRWRRAVTGSARKSMMVTPNPRRARGFVSGHACSQPDPLHLVLGEPLLGAVVELGCVRALMRRHFLRMLERAAVGEVSGDAGRAECVAADFLSDAGGSGPLADHAPCIRLPH